MTSQTITAHYLASELRKGATTIEVAASVGVSKHVVREKLQHAGYDHHGNVIRFEPPEPVRIFDLGDRDFTWQREAVCRDYDPAYWDSGSEDQSSIAIRVCALCPVRAKCLTAALEEESTDYPAATIRGGMTPADRYRIKRGRVA